MRYLSVVAATLAVGLGVANAHHPKHLKGCNTERCDRKAKRLCAADPSCIKRVTFKRWHRTADPYWGIFQAIAECESHGNWSINTGNGYFGGLQFDLPTWRSVGGRGLPSQALKLEQIYRATLLMLRRGGYGSWPVCRRAAGV